MLLGDAGQPQAVRLLVDALDCARRLGPRVPDRPPSTRSGSGRCAPRPAAAAPTRARRRSGRTGWSGGPAPGSRRRPRSGLVTFTSPVSRVDGEALTEISWVWLDCASLLSRVISRMAGLPGSHVLRDPGDHAVVRGDVEERDRRQRGGIHGTDEVNSTSPPEATLWVSLPSGSLGTTAEREVLDEEVHPDADRRRSARDCGRSPRCGCRGPPTGCRGTGCRPGCGRSSPAGPGSSSSCSAPTAGSAGRASRRRR